MDGNSLDLTGKKEEKQPLASYKALPEADMEGKIKEKSWLLKNWLQQWIFLISDEGISSAKVELKVKNYNCKDGADEKMLQDEESNLNSNNVDIPHHSIIIKEKNGDAKLDIGEFNSIFLLNFNVWCNTLIELP